MIIRNNYAQLTAYTQKELEQTNTNTEAEETENLLEKELKEISLGDSCDCDCIDGIDNDTYTSLVKKLKQLELDVLPRHVKQNVAKELQEQYQQAKIKNPCNCDCHNKAADLAEQLNSEENSDIKNALDKVKEESSFFNKNNWVDEIKNKDKDLAEQLNNEENSDLKNALDKVKEESSFFNKDNWIDEIKNKDKDLAEQLNSEENSDLKNALDKVKEENSFFNKDNWIDEIKNKAKDKAKDLAEQLNSEENKKNEQQKDENQHVIPNALRPKINRNNKNLFLR